MEQNQERYPSHGRCSCEELCYHRAACVQCADETTHWYDCTEPYGTMHCVKCDGYPVIFEVRVGRVGHYCDWDPPK